MSHIADDIVAFYNNVRRHFKLGNLPANTIEQQSPTNQPIAVSETI